MQAIADSGLLAVDAGSRLYLRLLLAWLCVLAVAAVYCLLHGLVAGDFAFEPAITIRWAFVHWGAWPILLPAGFHLIRRIGRRASLALGVLIAAPALLAGAAVFAYVADTALGGDRTFVASAYYTAPIAAGTYLFFVAIGFLLLHRSVHQTGDTERRAGTNDAAASLSVWKGRVRTTIPASDIEWARAARNYVELFAAGESYIVRSSMVELERELPDDLFLRAHRSYLVNRDRIAGLHGGRTRPSIVVRSGSRVPVGKTYKHAVLNAIDSGSST